MLMPLLPRNFHYDVQFRTHLGDDLESTAFNKRAACVFKHQAVTSASESKVRVFSPIPRMLEIKRSDAYRIVISKGHSDTLSGMATVKLCETARMGHLYAMLFLDIEEKLSLSMQENTTDKKEHKTLLQILTSSVPPTLSPTKQNGKTIEKLLNSLQQVLWLRDRFLEIQSKRLHVQLSIFGLCTDNSVLESDVSSILAGRTEKFAANSGTS